MTKHRLLIAATCATLVSACGGGGGGGTNSTPTPPVVAPPVVAPPVVPPKPIVNYDDAEYKLSNAASSAHALKAYAAGATGAGVKIAILDSGLTDALGEFTGRIDSASRDMAANRGYGDENGHGTSVAAVAAAGRNGGNTLGVAFDATVLALRTDDPGSCATGCSHFDSVLATAVDYARNNGARVINMSLGGSGVDSVLRAAIGRATAAGIVVVISAGNDGAADPDEFARVANSAEAAGLVVIAGSVDASGASSSFSNKAGSYGQYYIAALGDKVVSFDQLGDDLWEFSGTSYSAAGVSGAVALLAQAFPNLTGTQIVSLLMTTARDAGASGTDSLFGRGILDLTEAFAPQGAMSLAGSSVPISITNNAVLSSAMGDAGASTLGGAVFLDGYSRAYTVDLASTIGFASRTRPLTGKIGRDVRRTSLDLGGASVAMSFAGLAPGASSERWAGGDRSRMSNHPLAKSTALGGTLRLSLGENSEAVAAFGESITDGAQGASWLIADAAQESLGFQAERTLSLGMRQRFGRLSLAVTAENGSAGRLRRDMPRSGYSLLAIAGERVAGPVTLGARLATLREADTVLGAHFGAALGGGGALTGLADMSIAIDFGGNWSGRGEWRQAWTNPDRSGMLVGGALRSNAFAFDVVHTGRADRLGFRIAQPLRVEQGHYRLRMPTSYDYQTQAVGYSLSRLDLSPRGRELDIEASYGRMVGAGWMDANLYLRREPGNIADAKADVGAAVRYRLSF